ncbi:MAG: FHA domain-containing protein [Planctomycetota bacterium]|nr:FHA domain-containing protein [Planctomycetota bacterium]MDA1106439.1 FHA domain-containing protein [Planctomycetota bacterium]
MSDHRGKDSWRLEPVGGTGITVALGDSVSFTIGRGEDQDIRLEDPSVSRKHAVLRWSGRAWTIEDLDSTTGTVLSERKLAPRVAVQLSAGDSLRLGNCSFTVRGPRGSVSMTKTMADSDAPAGEIRAAALDHDITQAQLKALTKVADTIASATTPEKVAECAIEELAALTGLANVGFLRGNAEADGWTVLAAKGGMVRDGMVQVSSSLLREAERTKRTVILKAGSDKAAMGQSIIDLQIVESCVAPGVVSGTIYGYIVADNRGKGSGATVDFKKVSGHITSIAHIAGLALLRLVREDELRAKAVEIQKSFEATLRALARAVELKDEYTRGHQDRVAALGALLSRHAGLGDEMCRRVLLAGQLHDIGKIGVPDSVLNKEGKLTDEEFAQMKLHPTKGYDLMLGVPQWEPMLPGILHHHEKWNGRGYPKGLEGEGIPLIARVLCLADVFEALTSDRSYRKALSIDTALEIIRNDLGTHFDPALGKVFLSIPRARLKAIVNGESVGDP